jgi:hypothetical protein
MRLITSLYLVLASGAVLSACDFHGGVYRVYRLDDVPMPACVERTLRQVTGVTNVKYVPSRVDGRALHSFSYRAEGVDVRLDIEQEPVRPEYDHSYMVLNTVPAEELIARLRPVMARVDQALENDCGMRGLSRGARENCPRGPFRPSACTP